MSYEVKELVVDAMWVRVVCLFDYSYVYASNLPLKHEPYFLVNAQSASTKAIATLQQRINAHPPSYYAILLLSQIREFPFLTPYDN